MAGTSDYEGVVVLGGPRSGTTLLRRLVDAHPEICCPPETNLFVSAGRFLREERSSGGVGVGAVTGLGFSGFTEDDVVTRLREMVFGYLREIAVGAGCPIWAEKTAINAFYVDEIERLCGDRCRYLLIVRHPLDAVCSQMELAGKMESWLAELFEHVRRDPSPYVGLAHAWLEVNRRLAKFAKDHPEDAIVLRYEDLVEDPAAALERMFAFLDRPTDLSGLVERSLGKAEDVGLGDWKTYETRKIHGGSVGRWRKLSPETVARIAPVVDELAQSFGYGPIEGAAVDDPEEARRRYQLGMMAAQMRASMEAGKDDAGETA